MQFAADSALPIWAFWFKVPPKPRSQARAKMAPQLSKFSRDEIFHQVAWKFPEAQLIPLKT